MQKSIYGIISIILFFTAYSVNAEIEKKETKMTASGSFEVKMEPQEDTDAPAGRMVLRKEYSGDVIGHGIGQMLSKRTSGGAAAYSAVEEFLGSVSGEKGSFTLIHNGFMTSDTQKLEVYILPGSGAGELSNISGTLEIIQENGIHKYVLNYEL